MSNGICSGVIGKGVLISKSSTDLDRVKLCVGMGIGCRGDVCNCLSLSLLCLVGFGVVLAFLPSDLKCDLRHEKCGMWCCELIF